MRREKMQREIAPVGALGRIRDRLREITERGPARLPIGGRGGRGSKGQIQVGGGALVDVLGKQADRMVERVKTLRPGLMPVLSERLEVWYPGRRVSEVVVPFEEEKGAEVKREERGEEIGEVKRGKEKEEVYY